MDSVVPRPTGMHVRRPSTAAKPMVSWGSGSWYGQREIISSNRSPLSRDGLSVSESVLWLSTDGR